MAQVSGRILRHYNFLKKREKDPADCLVRSKEFVEGQDFFERSLYWKEGTYVFEVDLDMVGSFGSAQGALSSYFWEAGPRHSSKQPVAVRGSDSSLDKIA